MKKYAVRFFLLVKKWMHSPLMWIILLLAPAIPYLVNRTILPGRENNRILLYVPENSEYAEEIAGYLEQSDSLLSFLRAGSEEEAVQKVETAYADTAFLFAADLDEKAAQEKPQNTITVVSSSYSSKTEIAKETVYAAFYHVYTRVLMKKAANDYFPDRTDASGNPVSTEEIYEYMLRQSGYYAENGNLFKMNFRSVETPASGEDSDDSGGSADGSGWDAGESDADTDGSGKDTGGSGAEHGSRLFTVHGIYALLLFMEMILAAAPASDAGRTGTGVLLGSMRRGSRFRFRCLNILASAAIPALVFFVLFLVSEPLWMQGAAGGFGSGLPAQGATGGPGSTLPAQGTSATGSMIILSGFLAELLLWVLYILLAAVWAAVFSEIFRSPLTYNAWLLTLLAVHLILCPIFYDPFSLHRIPGLLGRLLPVGAYLHFLGIIG